MSEEPEVEVCEMSEVAEAKVCEMSEEPEAKRARFASKNGGETNDLSQVQSDVSVIPILTSQKEDSAGKVRRCSNCQNQGHNITTCPLLHPVDSAKSSAKSKPKKNTTNLFGRSLNWKFTKQRQKIEIFTQKELRQKNFNKRAQDYLKGVLTHLAEAKFPRTSTPHDIFKKLIGTQL